MRNLDPDVVSGFGREWGQFDQTELSAQESEAIFAAYFSIFPWHRLPANPRGFDLGCGSGRWAKLAAARVGELHCIDASEEALGVARRNLAAMTNCRLHLASVDEIPLEDGTMDFGYSLGVLHHVPDTQAGIRACVLKLKMGAPFLIYLYYAFDNRPWWFRMIWWASNLLRMGISRLPYPIKYASSQVIAVLVYLPLARGALVLEKMGVAALNLPLSAYRHRSFYVMRTDALDRFGTRLEQRFSKQEITEMMKAAGLDGITFSAQEPFWRAVGHRLK
jgi:SAM-dependent methyltransferase